VDEIIIFDENAQLKQSQIDEYYAGNWNGEEQIRENNSECKQKTINKFNLIG
jgi:hypothetical protein